jgi:tryptophan halogenase
MKVNNIVIVGGGSSGWITASFLIKTFPNKNIFVIESPTIPIVGVGESTLADVTNFRDYLGINEEEFMKECNASYKMSIKFTDFYEKDSGGFHYPFRSPDLSETSSGLIDWLEIKAFYPETPVTDFVESFFPHAQLFNSNKFDDNSYGQFGNWNPKTDVAYHFDAVKFGAYLRDKYAVPRGVNLITANVSEVKVEDQIVKYLTLDNGEVIKSDLFIDCTGFKGLLINESLKEPFISYDHILPNNRAWATQIPYKDKESELEPFTNCTAYNNGWIWNIPLWSRLGTGYVYSDKYISHEDALKEFKNYLKSNKIVCPRSDEEIDSLIFKDIPMRVGVHERVWVGNVVALGLSAGFIEPLESNGLFSVFWYVNYLSKCLLRDQVSQMDRDIFNFTARNVFNNLAEFVALHYALSIRRDTPYWIDISKRNFSPDLINKNISTAIGIQDFANRKMFTGILNKDQGITYISVGMNYPIFDRVDQGMSIFKKDIKPYIDNNISKFLNKKNKWKSSAFHSPTLYQYLKNKYYE